MRFKYLNYLALLIEPKYLKMIGLKTGALIECSVMLGAISSNKNLTKSDLNLISDFGKDIGLLFQIRDDILGVWGTDKTGKPVGGDIRKKKKSLPMILTINSNSTYDKDISEIMNKTKIEDNDIDKFIDIMEKIEIRKKCDEIAEEYLIKIQDTISKIPTSNKYKKTFNDITNFLMYREV